jgi:hypothetical protein
MEKGLDGENHLYIHPSIETLMRIRSLGANNGEFSLPITQNMGCNPSQFAHLANLEIKLVRYLWSHRKVAPIPR